jgi:hypothetical protein
MALSLLQRHYRVPSPHTAWALLVLWQSRSCGPEAISRGSRDSTQPLPKYLK